MSTNIADPIPTPSEWIATRRASQVLFTRHDVAAMVEAGVVPEDASTELLHGALLHVDRSESGEDPLSIGDDHAICVEALSELRAKINDRMCHIRSQQPLICSETNVPQPDFMILRGTLRESKGNAQASAALCVVEVADSSYERDSGEKLFGYARAGVAQYIIIDLRNRTAEVYTEPNIANGTYASKAAVTAAQVLDLRTGDGRHFSVPMAQILP